MLYSLAARCLAASRGPIITPVCPGYLNPKIGNKNTYSFSLAAGYNDNTVERKNRRQILDIRARTYRLFHGPFATLNDFVVSLVEMLSRHNINNITGQPHKPTTNLYIN